MRLRAKAVADLSFTGDLAHETAPYRPDSDETEAVSKLIYPTVAYYRWLGSRVVSVPDSGAEGPGFKSQPRRCRVTVLGKLFTPTVPLFIKQQKW